MGIKFWRIYEIYPSIGSNVGKTKFQKCPITCFYAKLTPILLKTYTPINSIVIISVIHSLYSKRIFLGLPKFKIILKVHGWFKSYENIKW